MILITRKENGMITGNKISKGCGESSIPILSPKFM